MGVIGRQREQVSLRLSAPSVEEAVATMQTRRDQARQQRLSLKAREDGTFTARVPGGRYSSPPRLRGRFELGDGGVVFNGVISEAHGSVFIPRMFTGMGAFFILVAILLAVVGNPSPGSYICGVGGVLFGLIGYGLGKLRRSSYRYDCKSLMGKLTPLMPGATPLDEDAASPRRHLP
jgi:hypothetical protein